MREERCDDEPLEGDNLEHGALMRQWIRGFRSAMSLLRFSARLKNSTFGWKFSNQGRFGSPYLALGSAGDHVVVRPEGSGLQAAFDMCVNFVALSTRSVAR